MKIRTAMKINTDARALCAAVLSAALAALFLSGAAAHAATIRMATTRSATSPAATIPAVAARTVLTYHSPSGSCVEAALLAAKDRHQLTPGTHLADALSIVIANRHTACAAFVDYLKQTSA